MPRVIYLVMVLYFSLGLLTFRSTVAQIERSQVEPHKQDEQRSPAQTGESSPPIKATVSSEPEDLSRIVQQIGGKVNLGTTETIDGIILVVGDAKIQGHVKGDIFVLRGDVEIGESAQVMGKVTVVLGKIIGKDYLLDEPETSTHPYEEINGWHLVPASTKLMMYPQEVWGMPRFGFGWGVLFVTLALTHMLLVIVFPQQMEGMAHTISHRPIGSTLLGLIVMIIVPYLSMLLILSIVGIPLMLLFFSILLSMAIYGKTAIFLSIGATIRSAKSRSSSPQRSSIISVIVGYSIYSLATWIPYFHINHLTFIIASAIGIGISLRTLFGQKPIRPDRVHRREYQPPRYHR